MSAVGKFYCNNHPSQGNSCVEIIDANHPIYSNPAHPAYPSINQVWIPGVPTLTSVDAWDNMVNTLPLDQIPTLYNTNEACETDCSNHYLHNCWDYNNNNTAIGQNSFYHLTTSQKNSFCEVCYDDTNDTVIKDHPYCWCINPQNGGNFLGTHLPFGSIWTKPPKAYTCNPEDSNIDLETADPLSKKLFLTIKIPIGERLTGETPDSVVVKSNNKVNFEATGLVQPINSTVSRLGYSEFISVFNNEVNFGNNKIGRYTITAIDDYYFIKTPLVDVIMGNGLRYDIVKSNLIYNDNKQLISITFDISYNCLEGDDDIIHNTIEFDHSLFTEFKPERLERAITKVVIENQWTPINSSGETKRIEIHGNREAKFTLTITDSSGCSILEEELENIPTSGGVYVVNQLFPKINPRLKSENYTINVTASGGAKDLIESDIVLYQYPDPTITITNTTSQTGPALTVVGDDITFTGKVKETRDIGQSVGTYNLTITESPSTAGYFYINGGGGFEENTTNNTVIKKIVSNEITSVPIESDILKLKPKSTRVDPDGSITGVVKVGMYFFGEVLHTKTVKASIGKTGCSDLTDKFTLTDTHDLFEGMIVSNNSGSANTVIKSIDNGTDVTFETEQIIKNESTLTFNYQIGGLIVKVINEVDNDGNALVEISGSKFIPNGTELSFRDDRTHVSSVTRVGGSGSDTITITSYIDILEYGIKDVTYTFDLDNFITRKPNAYSQEMFAIKDTAIIINVKQRDRDTNVKSKTVTIVKSPSHGAVTVLGDAPYPVTYTPYTGFTGEDSFTFTVSDGTTSSDEKRVFITVK